MKHQQQTHSGDGCISMCMCGCLCEKERKAGLCVRRCICLLSDAMLLIALRQPLTSNNRQQQQHQQR